jgi:hypothetical protein
MNDEADYTPGIKFGGELRTWHEGEAPVSCGPLPDGIGPIIWRTEVEEPTQETAQIAEARVEPVALPVYRLATGAPTQ